MFSNVNVVWLILMENRYLSVSQCHHRTNDFTTHVSDDHFVMYINSSVFGNDSL
jgi:hypothetical protein